jgi:hypothetical protein
VVVVNDRPTAVGVAIQPSRPFLPLVGKTVSFQSADDFADGQAAEAFDEGGRDQKLTATTGASDTSTPSLGNSPPASIMSWT